MIAVPYLLIATLHVYYIYMFHKLQCMVYDYHAVYCVLDYFQKANLDTIGAN